MYEPLLENLGLAKNEAKVYLTLLEEGKSSVGHIATKSLVHRRNVYDTLIRLVEKGLVFEIIGNKENTYQAVDPKKLLEILQEKQLTLERSLPGLEQMFHGQPASEAIYIYKGVEGWKNYMRDILRKGETSYIIAAKGVWANPKIQTYAKQFAKEAHNKGIDFKALVLNEAQERTKPVMEFLKSDYRVLPEGFNSTRSGIEVFGDQIVIIPDDAGGVLREEILLVVIINQAVADSFRTWFHALWEISSKPK